MVSPHIASTLRPRNVSKGSRLWRRDASRSAAPSAGTTWSGTKPRLNPSRTVDITRLSAPVGAWVSWSRTAANISEPVAAANPSTVRLTRNASHTLVVNAIMTHPTSPTTAPTLNSDSRSVSRSDHLPTTNPRIGAARLVRKNNPATGSDACKSCTKNSDSWGMAIEIPRPAKNRLTVARRYSREPTTRPSVELDLVVTACSGMAFSYRSRRPALQAHRRPHGIRLVRLDDDGRKSAD